MRPGVADTMERPLTPRENPLLSARSESRPSLGLRLFHLLVATVIFAACFLAYFMGLLTNAFNLLILAAVPWTLATRLWGVARGTLGPNLFRRPLAPHSRPYLLQALNRGLFWALAVVASHLAVVPLDFDPAEFRTVAIVLAAAAGLVILLQFVPMRRRYLSLNALALGGWVFLAVQLTTYYLDPLTDQGVVLDVPFDGTWYVVHGGRSALFNHHYPLAQQRHALDLVKVQDDKEREGDPERLESYFAWGQKLYAPAEGKVVRAVNDRPDNRIGDTDERQLLGNHVIVQIAPERFVLFAHMQKDSVAVAQGQEVKAGQLLGRCGNSGNTSAPHVHLQVQNKDDFWADGLETYPIFFRNATRIRDGQTTHEATAYVRRNDRIERRE